MIQKSKKSLAARYYGKKLIAAVYKGSMLIWEAVSSCFGSGFWREELPWKDDDAWKDL